MDQMSLAEGRVPERSLGALAYHEPSILNAAVASARNSAWLAGKPASFGERFLAGASLRRYRRGQVIIEFDQREPGVHFLLEGAVEVSVPRPTGELLPVQMVLPMNWFGEIGALTGRGQFAEYCTRMACTTLFVRRTAIVALEAESSADREILMDMLSHSVRNLLWMFGDLSGLDPERRVMSKLVTLTGSASADNDGNEHVLPISQAELGIVCCLSRGTTNLILARLEKAGVVRLGYRRVVVLKRQRLIAALREER